MGEYSLKPGGGDGWRLVSVEAFLELLVESSEDLTLEVVQAGT